MKSRKVLPLKEPNAMDIQSTPPRLKAGSIEYLYFGELYLKELTEKHRPVSSHKATNLACALPLQCTSPFAVCCQDIHRRLVDEDESICSFTSCLHNVVDTLGYGALSSTLRQL